MFPELYIFVNKLCVRKSIRKYKIQGSYFIALLPVIICIFNWWISGNFEYEKEKKFQVIFN